MTRYAIRAALLLACSTPVAAQRYRVIDAAAIAAAGWHRLGDIAAALPPGSTASIDGFNHNMTGSRVGFSSANSAAVAWVVRVDGQMMPVNLRGLWILDAIPVAMPQVDSIVITEGPRIVDGRPVHLGTIDLYTRRPRRGASLIADYQHGDESGDPGPYRYTSRATGNVEKLGPFASGAAAYATGRGAVDVAARYSSLNITDERIASRFPGSFGLIQSDVNASGGSGVASLSLGGGDHYVIGGRGRFTGLMHRAGLGDRTGRVVTSHAGISGSLVNRSLIVRYAATASELELEPLGALLPATPREDRKIGDAFVEAGRAGSAFRFGAGANVGAKSTALVRSRRRTERVWINYDRKSIGALVSAERAVGSIQTSASVRGARTLRDSEVVALSLTAVTGWLDGNNAWMDGVGLAEAHIGDASALDARLELSTRSVGGLRPTWYARAFRIGQDDSDSQVTALAAGFNASATPSPTSRVWLRGEISQPVGDAADDEPSTPGGFVEGSGSVRAPGGFDLALSARFAPATHWSPLAVTPSEVPTTRRIDLSVNKWLWHQRIRGQLVIRNLLNAAEMTHPLGAQWNFRTHLAVTVVLP
jgi:hypothetical protein